jgi:hypothetical protein
MGRQAEISEERVFKAIREMEDHGKNPNAGAIHAHFGRGCAKRYEDLLNQYFAHKLHEEQVAKKLAAVQLPDYIEEMLAAAINRHANDYRNDFTLTFSEAANIGQQRIDGVNLKLEQAQLKFKEAKKDFFIAIEHANKNFYELEEKLQISEARNKQYESEIQSLTIEKESIFQSMKAIEEAIKENHDMKNIINKLMKNVEEKT